MATAKYYLNYLIIIYLEHVCKHNKTRTYVQARRCSLLWGCMIRPLGGQCNRNYGKGETTDTSLGRRRPSKVSSVAPLSIPRETINLGTVKVPGACACRAQSGVRTAAGGGGRGGGAGAPTSPHSQVIGPRGLDRATTCLLFSDKCVVHCSFHELSRGQVFIEPHPKGILTSRLTTAPSWTLGPTFPFAWDPSTQALCTLHPVGLKGQPSPFAWDPSTQALCPRTRLD